MRRAQAGVRRVPRRLGSSASRWLSRRVVRLGLPLLLASGLAGGIVLATQSRVEAVICSKLASREISIVSTTESQIRISHDPVNALGDSVIRVNEFPCGTFSTVLNINVKGSDFAEDLQINQINGRFVFQGREITFSGDLDDPNAAGGDPNSLTILGTGGIDNVTFGQDGIASKGTLNSDAAAEIAIGHVDRLNVALGGGNDAFSAQGTGLALAPLTVPADLKGEAGGDSLVGGDADDTLQGNGGDDTRLDGGPGTDTVSYADAPNGVSVNLASGTATGHGSDSNIAAVEKVVTTPFDDVVVGSASDDSFDGLAGDDTLDYSGATTPMTVNFAEGVAEGAGRDTFGGSFSKTNTGDGNDIVYDGPTCNTVFTNGGDDQWISNSIRPGREEGGTCGDDIHLGETLETDGDLINYQNMLVNSPGGVVDLVLGVVKGSPPPYDTIGADCEVEDVIATEGEDDITGCADRNDIQGLGNHEDPGKGDVIRGGGGDDVIDGGAGDDLIEGGAGNDAITGGAGVDTLDYLAENAGMTVDFAAGTATGTGTDTFNDMEGSRNGDGNDTFIDGPTCVSVFGNGGDDKWLSSTERPGREEGGTCGDDIDLGETFEVAGDLIDYSRMTVNSPGGVIDLVLGVVKGSPPPYDYIGECVAENVIATVGEDEIYGCDEANNIQGLGGHEDPGKGDIISGAGGNDVIDAGAGDDTVDGGTGDDTLTGGDGTDTFTSLTGESSVNCNLATGQFSGSGSDSASSFENCKGGAGNDVLTGSDGNNVLDGGAGNDTIDGGAGNDTIDGGDGNDTLRGGNGQDTIEGGAGDDDIDGGNGNDTIRGGAGNDTLRGGSNGGDTIYGEEGDDRLFGGNGPDYLDGGAGNDFGDGGEGPDRCAGVEEHINCEQHVA